MRYYFDTCIWIDFLEDRKGFNGEPLGSFAYNLIKSIIKNKDKIFVSDIIIKELNLNITNDNITNIFLPLKRNILFVHSTDPQIEEANNLSSLNDVPFGDAFHCIFARDYNLKLITRDNHYKILKNIWPSYKPEELLL